MKNSLCDLNDHLFVMLEDVMNTSEEEASTEEINNVCKKAKTVTSLAKTIINNASVELEAMQFINSSASKSGNIPEMLLPKNTSTETYLPLPGDKKK